MFEAREPLGKMVKRRDEKREKEGPMWEWD